MIETNVVRKLVDEWLKDKDYFLTDLTISPDDRIVVEIDHQDGVWIEDCVELSRFIEDGLDRDAEDFELEVGSAEFRYLFAACIHQTSISPGLRE